MYILLLVYADDIIVTGCNDEVIANLASNLHAQFALKQLRSLHYFLGIEETRNATGYYLCPLRYVADLLQCLNMTSVKSCLSPAAPDEILSKLFVEAMDDPFIYHCTIGALQYVTMTWPDIAHDVDKLSQFLQAPTSTHWPSSKRVLRYLKSTITHALTFKPTRSLYLTSFVDDDRE